MSDLLYLSRQEVVELLPSVLDQIDLVERTYLAMAAGRVDLPPKPGVRPRKNAFIHAMPAYLADDDVVAIKWVGGYRSNKERDLPYISGLIIVNDAETGLPLGVMDAAEITAARTAAASGACIRRFAPPGWSRVGIVGCGEQGRYHSRVLVALNPDVVIGAYDVHPGRVHDLAGEITPAAGPRQAIENAEIIITGLPIVERPEPSIPSEWLGDRYLALPIDFDSSFQVGPIADAGLFLSDDPTQFEYYRGIGHFHGWPEPHRSVGEAIRRNDSAKRVACCNLGVGALDAAFARVVFDRAVELGVGTRLAR